MKSMVPKSAASDFLEKSVCASTYKNISFIIDIYYYYLFFLF